MTPLFKTAPREHQQRLLFPSNIYDVLADDHPCRVYYDLFQQLDTTKIEKQYSLLGQHAYHPKHIVSILIYAYSRSVFSARQIQQRCQEDLSFMYVAQMHCPNFRVLSDFRKKHADFFHDCFKQTVKLAMALNLASLGHISLDGSKFKANSSKHKAMSYGRLKKEENALNEEINTLIKQGAACDEEEDKRYKEKTGYEIPEDLAFKQQRLSKIKAAKEALEARENALYPEQAIEDKKQISFADHDARIMGKRGSEFTYAYNPQISVDSDNQIIVGQHISQKANDQQEVKPALEQIEATTGQQADKMSLDNGYLSGDNLAALDKVETEAYVALNREDKPAKESLNDSTRPLKKSDFRYDEEKDHFICPADQILHLIQTKKDGRTVYQGDKETCSDCPYKARCCQSKKGAARCITGDQNEALRQQMKKTMESDAGKAIYSHRKTIVEPVFGQIKNTGFRAFSLRGMKKVAGEFSLVCATHNLKKIVTQIMTGSVRPETMKRFEIG